MILTKKNDARELESWNLDNYWFFDSMVRLGINFSNQVEFFFYYNFHVIDNRSEKYSFFFFVFIYIHF